MADLYKVFVNDEEHDGYEYVSESPDLDIAIQMAQEHAHENPGFCVEVLKVVGHAETSGAEWYPRDDEEEDEPVT